MKKDKPSGSISISDKESSSVAVFLWYGTLNKGEGEWSGIQGHGIAEKITYAVAAGANLVEVYFSNLDTDMGRVRGWQGFSGYLQALRQVLPTVGLTVDLDTTIWPTEK